MRTVLCVCRTLHTSDNGATLRHWPGVSPRVANASVPHRTSRSGKCPARRHTVAQMPDTGIHGLRNTHTQTRCAHTLCIPKLPASHPSLPRRDRRERMTATPTRARIQFEARSAKLRPSSVAPHPRTLSAAARDPCAAHLQPAPAQPRGEYSRWAAPQPGSPFFCTAARNGSATPVLGAWPVACPVQMPGKM